MEQWDSGDAYEVYMGRWSHPIADKFVAGLGINSGKRWLDVGCGTGTLAKTILTQDKAASVWGVDPSASFVGYARQRLKGSPAQFWVGNAAQLPFEDHAFDVVVSGLALNFMPEGAATREMQRVTRPGGLVAAYVWDYSGQMEWLRHFWDAAVMLDPAAKVLDEGERFPTCRQEPLRDLFMVAGFSHVEAYPVDVPTRFTSFNDYWEPFLCRQFPAPQYVASLNDDQREALRAELYRRLSINAAGAIELVARAWAVQGVVA
jgi:SAM-dependent methyltransferase